MPTRVPWFGFFFQAEDGIRDYKVTGVQTCALPISLLDLLAPTLGPVTWPEVLERAGNGDLGCRRVMLDAGGPVRAAAAMVCHPVKRAAIPSAAADAEVVAGVLGERAEVLGAIALVLRESEPGASLPVLPKTLE